MTISVSIVMVSIVGSIHKCQYICFSLFCRCDRNQTVKNGTLPNSPPEEPNSHEIFSINWGLQFYAFLTPFIILFGLLGNSISLCIFQKQSLRNLSASFYLRAICLSDICVLLTYVLLDWLNKGLPRWPGGFNIPLIHNHGFCQTFLYFSHTFRIISVWLINVFTFERYVAICWPYLHSLILPAYDYWCQSHSCCSVSV